MTKFDLVNTLWNEFDISNKEATFQMREGIERTGGPKVKVVKIGE